VSGRPGPGFRPEHDAGLAGASRAPLADERKCTMKMFPKILVALVLALGGGGAVAQVTITLGLPVVLPTLVVVQPGVSVIPNQPVEVFYSGGYYWTRRDNGWYRTHDHNGGWARIDERHVPVVIVQSPPGQYKHYKGNGQGDAKGKSDKGHGKSDKHGGDDH
jgi:hypothetical protein